MTEPTAFRDTNDERLHLVRQLEQARVEELAAISKAAALVKSRASLELIAAAHRQCEMARVKKQQLLDKLIEGPAA